MGRFRISVALIAVLAAIGCDRSVATAPVPSNSPDARIVSQLQAAGYRGPVIVAERTPTDSRGIGRKTRRLFLPSAGMAALRRADPARVGTIRATLLQQGEVTDPNLIDVAHNDHTDSLGTVVRPSVLNIAAPAQSLVQYRMQFYSYDYANDRWYVVQNGTVSLSYITARDSSSGHWHGSVDTTQRHVLQRVGRLNPATGSITSGSWSTEWRVPEVSNEVSFAFNVTEIGGPNDGDNNWFYSLENDGARFTGLQRLPENALRYSRVGGTPIHPEAFNDWGTADIITRIERTANTYFNRTGDLTRVNDIALFYGGRFDIGRTVNRVFTRCGETGAAQAACWQYSHYEHRFGTEVDINPESRGDPRRRAQFYAVLLAEFRSVITEGDHYHARGAGSPYPR